MCTQFNVKRFPQMTHDSVSFNSEALPSAAVAGSIAARVAIRAVCLRPGTSSCMTVTWCLRPASEAKDLLRHWLNPHVKLGPVVCFEREGGGRLVAPLSRRGFISPPGTAVTTSRVASPPPLASVSSPIIVSCAGSAPAASLGSCSDSGSVMGVDINAGDATEIPRARPCAPAPCTSRLPPPRPPLSLRGAPGVAARPGSARARAEAGAGARRALFGAAVTRTYLAALARNASNVGRMAASAASAASARDSAASFASTAALAVASATATISAAPSRTSNAAAAAAAAVTFTPSNSPWTVSCALRASMVASSAAFALASAAMARSSPTFACASAATTISICVKASRGLAALLDRGEGGLYFFSPLRSRTL
mmetsp:Transcript_10752/g.26342  ORF Transcript_10752/g.26342 Transcript_10752/m.26342 type:complete len:369 (-) Transcript_10752:165-1271(-)